LLIGSDQIAKLPQGGAEILPPVAHEITASFSDMDNG